MTDNATRMTDDEQLSAYLDGELPEEEANAVSERLANEPALMRRFEAMRASDAMVRKIYEAVDQTPMPEAVTQLFDAPASDSASDNVVAFPAHAIKRFFEAPVAIAASVALLAGFLGANFLRQDVTSPGESGALVAGAVAEESQLHGLLEFGVSGEPTDIGDNATAELVFTFQDTSGDFCRQLHVDQPDHRVHGVACRRDAVWQLETIAIAPASGGPYAPAGSDTPAAISGAVDALIGAGEPLDEEQENLFISEGWKKPSE